MIVLKPKILEQGKKNAFMVFIMTPTNISVEKLHLPLTLTLPEVGG